MSIKGKLHKVSLGRLEDRINSCLEQLKELRISLENETKSSAGDKHEVGRAMIQLEIEKRGEHLSKLENQFQVLSKLQADINPKSIGLGSVVFTTMANYFISISGGEINLDDKNYYVISPQSPIGSAMIGHKKGDTISFRGSEMTIVNVL